MVAVLPFYILAILMINNKSRKWYKCGPFNLDVTVPFFDGATKGKKEVGGGTFL